MRNELANLGLSHFLWMALVMEEDKAPDPADVGAFGTQAEMLDPDHSSNLIEQSWARHDVICILCNEGVSFSGALIIPPNPYLRRGSAVQYVVEQNRCAVSS